MSFNSELRYTNSIAHSKAVTLVQQRDSVLKSIPDRYLKSLLALVIEFQSSKCVDIRDKIYGLHSLAPSCCRKAVPVDYECAAYGICSRLLEHHFNGHLWRHEKHSMIALSQTIHQLIIGGAMRQKDSQNSFIIDTPDQIKIKKLHDGTMPSRVLLDVTGFISGTVNFITPPLRDLGRGDEAEFEVRIPHGEGGIFF